MKKLSGSLISIAGLLYTLITFGQSQGDNDFQQQLQRLQTAVTQARQTSTPLGATPAFNPNPPAGTTTPSIAPPLRPPLNQPQTNVTTTTTTTGPMVATGTQTTTTLPGDAINQSDNETSNLRDQAFSETTDNLLPLTPDQIRTLHGLFSNTQRAVGETPGIPPRPTSSSKIVNLSCGATPPIIRLSAGFVTSLVFLDASGAPWPIDSYDLGDPRSYNIQWDKKSNMLLVQAITEYKSGNLAVMLRGFGTPVMLTLLPGQRAVDYRVDLRIPSLGPNANPTSFSGGTSMSLGILPGASNPILLDVLNGIPPVGSRALQIPGRDCQVWLVGGKIYLRTRLTVLSPAWLATLSSADGMHAYEMLPTPVILASENGKMVKLTIQGL